MITPAHTGIDDGAGLLHNRCRVTQQDLERIGRAVLKELGLGDAALAFEPAPQPGRWRLLVSGRPALIIRCGPGSTAQFVRSQIFDQLRGS
jgi:hypothetical protein